MLTQLLMLGKRIYSQRLITHRSCAALVRTLNILVGFQEIFPDFCVQLLISPGLFAPAAGQTVRDEQRRRRSQFDRGTTMAEQENDLNYDFDAEYDPELGFPFNGKHIVSFFAS